MVVLLTHPFGSGSNKGVSAECSLSQWNDTKFRSKGKLYSLIKEREGASSGSRAQALLERSWAGLLYRGLKSGRGQSSAGTGRGSGGVGTALLPRETAGRGAASAHTARSRHLGLQRQERRFRLWRRAVVSGASLSHYEFWS